MISPKRLLPSLLFISLLACPVENALAQTTDSALAYYPMHVGDQWQYIGYMVSPSYLLYVQITGDTVAENGSKYFIFNETNTSSGGTTYWKRSGITTYWKRLDSLSGSIYKRVPPDTVEIQDDSLRAQPGDYFNLHTLHVYPKLYVSAFIDTVFGVTTPAKGVAYALVGGPSYALAYGIGLYRWSYDDGQSLGLEVRKLVYAKIDGVEYGTPLGVTNHPGTPINYALGQNYPNPFNPSTTFEYFLPRTSSIRISIFNLIGQVVSQWTYLNRQPGRYSLTWTPNLPSGVYFYKIDAVANGQPSERFTKTRSMVLVK